MENLNNRVAIFDDDEDVLSICRYILEERGFEVTTFSDCNDIIAKVASAMPLVILMDNRILDCGGVEATRTLKSSEKFSHIPVVYFSANTDIEKLARSAGADTFLAKPFNLEDLERVISSVLS